jgi:outer membrane lipoprotein-sorting protein
MKHAFSRLSPFLLTAVLARAQDAPPRFLEDAERARFFDQLEERMAARKTVAAEFEQEKVLALFEGPVRSRGVILFEAPGRGASGGKLRWEIQAPCRSLLIVAGDDVAKFEFSADGQRRALALGRGKDPLLAVMDQIRGWFLGRFDRREKTYRLKVAREPDPLVVLEPIEDGLRKTLKAIEVSLTRTLDGVQRVTILEQSGDRTTMTFHEPRRVAAIPAEYFDLEDPRALDLDALLAAGAKSGR